MVSKGQRRNLGDPLCSQVGLSMAGTSPLKARLTRRHGVESDKPIVVMKPGNAGGAKGLESRPCGYRATFPGHGTGTRKTIKTVLRDLLDRG